MAIVTQPLGSVEARGSVGAYTYATWRGKRTVRSRAGPSREPTEDQLAILALTQAAVSIWSAKTDTDRANWDHFAAEQREPDWTGTDKRLTGQNWFVRCWVRCVLALSLEAIDPPSGPIADYIADLHTLQINGGLWIGWNMTQAWGEAKAAVDVWIAGPHSPGRHPTIHNADRKFSTDVAESPSVWTPPSIGLYTVFWRVIDLQGLATPFQQLQQEIT